MLILRLETSDGLESAGDFYQSEVDALSHRCLRLEDLDSGH